MTMPRVYIYIFIISREYHVSKIIGIAIIIYFAWGDPPDFISSVFDVMEE